MERRWIESRFGQTTLAVWALLACAHSGDLTPVGGGATGGTGGTSTNSGGATTVSSGGGDTGDGGMTAEGGRTAGGTTGKGGTSGASATGVAGRSAAGGTKAAGGMGIAGSTMAGSAGRTGSGGAVSLAGSTAKGGTSTIGVAGATGSDDFKCSAANSKAVEKDIEFDAALDECYTWTKPSSGTFQIGNWSGTSMTMQVKDSKKVFADIDVKSSAWTPVSGVATGDIFFYLSDISAGTTARIKISAY